MLSRGLGLLAALFLVAVFGIVIGLVLLGGDTVCPGVSVAGIDLGGLSVEQAASRLASRASELGDTRVVLRHKENEWPSSIHEFGGRLDVAACARAAHGVGRRKGIFERVSEVISARRKGTDLPALYAFSVDAASAHLRKLALNINADPADAEIEVREGSIRVVPAKPGIELQVAKSIQQICSAVNSGGREVDLAVSLIAPKVFAEDFEGIDGVIASYSTAYKPWERDRTHNLKLACRALDRALLQPGELFSYNKLVGPRLKKYGFRKALIFMRGEAEPGVGGGVCQVSTTVYNAALLADLEIVSRSRHSQPVVYAPVGRDATVAYGSIDLQFRNTTDSPIYIRASVGKKTVDVHILGKRQDGREVRLISTGHRVIPAPTVEEVDSELEPGERVVRRPGRSGHRVSVYRIVKVDGVVTKRELVSKNYYRPEKTVIAVGPPP